MSFIRASKLSKSYGKNVALLNVDLEIKEKSIFGLLGPNGAGKTTFVKCLLNLVNFQDGTFTIDGMDVRNYHAREHVALLPEKFNFFPFYTVNGAVDFFAKMHHPSNKQKQKDLSKTALELVNISELGNRKLATLSKGQLQRVGLANLIVSESKLLILDEPFSGLDPIGMKDLKKIMIRLNQEMGATILLNSHILSEVKGLCHDIGILNKGVCLASGSMHELVGSMELEDYFYQLIEGPSRDSSHGGM